MMRVLHLLFSIAMPFVLIQHSFGQPPKDDQKIPPRLTVAKRGSFSVLISEPGYLASEREFEIRSQVSGPILAIVKEGTKVKPGDFVFQVSTAGYDSALQDKRNELAGLKAEMRAAEAELFAAKRATLEYANGAFAMEKKALENELTFSEKRLAMLSKEFEAEKKMKNATKTTLRKMELAIHETKSDLELAKMKRDVLVNLTFGKIKAELDANVEASEAKIIQLKLRYELAIQRMEQTEEKILACRVVVPDGVQGAIYFNRDVAENFPDSVDTKNGISVGSVVSEGQTIFVIPDPSRQKVTVPLTLEKATKVSPSMLAKIEVSNKTYRGIVTSISLQHLGSTADGDDLVGRCEIRMLDSLPVFLPGLQIDVQIKTNEVLDKLCLPIDAVLEHGGDHYCCVHQDGVFKTKKLKTGNSNSRFVEIVQGLRENEEVLRNAASRTDLFNLPNVENPRIDKSFNFTSGKDNKTPQKPEVKNPKNDTSAKSRSNLDPMVNQMMTQLDANKNGFLDKDELEKLAPAARERILKSDTNDDGQVSRSELVQFMEKARSQMNRGRGSGDRH